jgi:hypothetical protein
MSELLQFSAEQLVADAVLAIEISCSGHYMENSHSTLLAFTPHGILAHYIKFFQKLEKFISNTGKVGGPEGRNF